jgi:UDP-glucose 4-epimerase
MDSNAIIDIIIGKNSNLSCELFKKNPNFILISSREILLDNSILKEYRESKIRLIFNNFQPSTELGSSSSYSEYIKRAILSTSMVLDYFDATNIVKIIYTSSSSVYGNNILCSESDDVKVMNFHAGLKVSNEKMIESFCKNHSVDYTIARIFNMYGGDDKFSIISKIINAHNKKESLTVLNSGSAIRDFIHIDNVVDIYIKLLSKKNINIINIGTGNGNSVKNILLFLNSFSYKIETINIVREEIEVSTANIKLLDSIFKSYNFIQVESYLQKKLSL